MEKKLLILIVSVFTVCVVFSFFAGTIVGIVPLGMPGVSYSCPKWKCTYLKQSTTQQTITTSIPITFNGYTFVLFPEPVVTSGQASPVSDILNLASYAPSQVVIQIKKGDNVLDTFWIKLKETHYTSDGNTTIYTTLLNASFTTPFDGLAFVKIVMYYPSTFYVCSFDNPGNCEPYGSCRYCPMSY